jgi:hypothetical protein
MSKPKWQSMETAPRDGTPILAWDGHGVLCVGYREVSDGTAIWEIGHSVAGFYIIPALALTHWMPLPEPPRAA